MDKPLPYVTAALLCEKVLQEKDGSLSVIRIADRVEYRLEGAPEGLRPTVTLAGIVALRSGPVSGDHFLKIIIENPHGDRKEVHRQQMTLAGEDKGQNLILNLNLAIEHEGLYWFDVLFDEDLLTRIPLTVLRRQEQTPHERKN